MWSGPCDKSKEANYKSTGFYIHNLICWLAVVVERHMTALQSIHILENMTNVKYKSLGVQGTKPSS